MKTISMRLQTIILALCTLLFLNCEPEKKNTASMDFSYADQPRLIKCSGMDTLLLNEALYSFQDDITKHYTSDNENLPLSYRNFTNDAIIDRAEYATIISEHSKEVFKTLKQTPGLWRVSGDSYTFDFEGPLFACMVENIKDSDFKTTLNALLKTNSMSSRMITEPLRQKTFLMKEDPYLASIVAFDLYYGKMFDLDLSKTPEKKEAEDPGELESHEGHNH